ncbi:MAG: hypothetical protein CMK07_09950 [Ponticaulis sp.]|nr:hypothetical protein [Ponticaulis sp.]
MSEDKQGVSLEMLETRLNTAEANVVSALKARSVASRHLLMALQGEGNTIAMTVVSSLSRLARQAKATDQSQLLLRWGVEFLIDMHVSGLEQVCVSGAEPIRIFDQARSMFGHQIPMQFEKDPRDTLQSCADKDSCVGVLGWMTQAGSGQWWPMLNESKYHDLRIIGGWPIVLADAPYAAIVARGPLADTPNTRTLLMAHDDHLRLKKIFGELGLYPHELSRARSLVLFEISESMAESDPRLTAAREAGLDGLRVVGSLPAFVAQAANDDAVRHG